MAELKKIKMLQDKGFARKDAIINTFVDTANSLIKRGYAEEYIESVSPSKKEKTTSKGA